MPNIILPLPVIVFQTLFLLISICLEAFVLHRCLFITRKISIEYALSINLLANFLGWIVFFIVEKFIPHPWRGEMISYVFFDHLIGKHEPSFYIPIVFLAFIIFTLAFLLKFKALELLRILLKLPPLNVAENYPPNHPIFSSNNPPPSLLQTILWANACTYTAILILLLLRAFIQWQKNLLFSL
jgi:hypothetical protein